jgi:putative hemolysin
MKTRLSTLGVVFILSGLILAACRPTGPGAPEPSSVYCKEQGYTYEVRTLREPAVEVVTPTPSTETAEGPEVPPPPPRELDSGISYSVCVFPDGTECWAWAFFRGECLPGQLEHAEDGLPIVNIVQEAGLAQTVALDILKLNTEPSDEPYSHLMTISDEQELDQIIAALDVPIWTLWQEDCTTRYKLHFRLADGSVQEFDYHAKWERCTWFDFGERCHPNQESILRGDQEFLVAGDGGRPPGTFDGLIKEQIASTWAESINLAEELELARTVEIEILEGVVSRLTTDDPQVIEQIVAALDREYGFVTRGCFNTKFELQFRLDDRTVQILRFGSEGDNPTVLRGHPDIWEDRDMRPSADFDALIETLLASAR